MIADIVSKVEKLLQRELSQEEKERFTRVKEILNISDDDAVWDLLVAMEYQRSYYEALPEKIRDTTLQIIAEINENQKMPACEVLLESKVPIPQQIKQYFVMGMIILSIIIIYGSLTMWAGVCIGSGNYHPPLLILKMPVGILLGIAGIIAGGYLVVMAAKLYANNDIKWRKLIVPSMLSLILGSTICAISFLL